MAVSSFCIKPLIDLLIQVMLILFIYSTLIVYAIAAVGFIILSFGTVLSFVGLFLGLLVFLTFLYLHGLNTENDCLMLPFLVSEVSMFGDLMGSFLDNHSTVNRWPCSCLLDLLSSLYL